GHALSRCSAPDAPLIRCIRNLLTARSSRRRVLARLPSINVIFLAFGEGSPAASLCPLRVRSKGASDELDNTCVAKRTNCASAIPAGSGARALAASTAAFAHPHATARNLVGSS